MDKEATGPLRSNWPTQRARAALLRRRSTDRANDEPTARPPLRVVERRAPGVGCTACLDTRMCWVCEGVGRVPVRYRPPEYEATTPCTRCHETRVCTECGGAFTRAGRLPVPIQRRFWEE